MHVFLTSTYDIMYLLNVCVVHYTAWFGAMMVAFELEPGVFFIWFVMLHMTFEIMIKNIVFLAIRCNATMQVI